MKKKIKTIKDNQMRVCIQCGKKDSSNGWCPKCQRCWDCMNKKCIEYINKNETQIEEINNKELFEYYKKVGYCQGRLYELRKNMPFASINWWLTFLCGIIWGILISLWTGVLI